MFNNESIEMFFAGLDEETMEKLINIYEKNDFEELESVLNELSIEAPKEQLIEALKMLIEMKGMMGDF